MICCVHQSRGHYRISGTPTYSFVKAYGANGIATLKDSMRSTLYDTVSDRYVRFFATKSWPKFCQIQHPQRRVQPGHYRFSSGGICSFNAAWQMPEQFSRVITWIGSFGSIQWKEDPAIPDGGQDYPDKVLREPKRNIRVWLQDGSNDLDVRFGNWPH